MITKHTRTVEVRKHVKIRYIGTAKDINLVGFGMLQPNDIIEVSPMVGKQLIQRPDFVEVVEKPKPRRRVPRPKPIIAVTAEAVPPAFEIKEESESGGE